MPKPYPTRHIVKVLKAHGFVFVSQTGSHGKFRRGNRSVIVPMAKHEIPPGTVGSIIRQSGLPKEALTKKN